MATTAATPFEGLMSERGIPSEVGTDAQAAHEQQSRFISDNLRRVFLLIYRIVGNVADAHLTRKTSSRLSNAISN